VFTQAEDANSAILNTEHLVSISAGSCSVCAIGQAGIGYCWGYNSHGQLGIGNTTNSNVAKQITVINSFASLITGFDNAVNYEPVLSCGLSTDDKFYCCGRNNAGQVGIGTDDGSYSTPQELVIP